MRALTVVCALLALASGATARELSFPLAVDYSLLQAAIARQLHVAGGEGVVWEEARGCRSLVLRDLHVERSDARVRVTARGRARIGFGLFGWCLVPVGWDGYVETFARPAVGADWQLRFQDLESHVYDREWQRTTLASRLWELLRGRVEREVGNVAVDLGPPVSEARALVRASVDPGRAGPVVAALETLHPTQAAVDDEGVKVMVAVDLPATAAVEQAPEPALSPIELQKWQGALEHWDAFLVFVIKNLGSIARRGDVRDDLLDLLLTSRHQLLTVLASGPAPGVDPVRQLFLDAWEQLRAIVRRGALQGGAEDRVVRFATFLVAGDILAALDAAGPGLGIEISADGLRRLARTLEPNYEGDPVAYSEAPDATLRELFQFHEPEQPGGGPSPGTWWWPGPGAAEAADVAPPDLAAVVRRLERWVPNDSEREAYRDAVARLLSDVAERAAEVNAIEARFRPVFAHLVPTVGWQESCWRQFVEKDHRVTFLLSGSGDVGLMQVNRRVWRGFFDLEKLEWDIAYNAGAGAEILAQLLNRYGVREGRGQVENGARATYSAYNGGPDAYRRYRLARVARTERAIDVAFWKKYQAMAAGRALDFVLCIQGWSPSRTQLSVVPRAATPNSCMRSRRSSATRTIEACHISIARRPIASFV